jgi:phospholipid/cholesterol/gamma-HCH transport system ATP-binding protein
MTDTAKIHMSDVYKSFGKKQVLQGFNLTVAKAQSLVIIGGSGTGKSVTIKCIQGLLTPEAGSITIDGQETVGLGGKKRDQLNERMGMLFQNAALFDSLSVWENVIFGVVSRTKMPAKEARDLAVDKLKMVGLTAEVANLFPSELSGGMKKRVGLARAIAANPEIIFFDEPTTGLDPIMSDVINDLIVQCVKTLGATAVTITHDMTSAKRIADKVTMLYQGKDLWTGKVDDIEHSGNPYVEQFIHGRSEGPITIG